MNARARNQRIDRFTAAAPRSAPRLCRGKLRDPRSTIAFTLIEMLTVLVIMGIMLGIGIPAVTNLMKSGALGAATRHVSNTLSQARQYAITQRVNTLVVFPYSGTVGPGTNQAPPYLSYSVFFTNRTTGASGYLSKWELLPVGTVFMDDNSILGAPPRPCLDKLGTAYLPFPNTNIPVNSATLSYIAFTPTGAASNTCTFTLTEGFVDNSSGTPVIRPTSKTSGGTTLANVATVTVDNVVGRIRVTRP